MKRLLSLLTFCLVLFAVLLPRPAAEEGGAQGYRLYEATAATVNGRVIFLSDVVRESCLRRCGAFRGDEAVDLSLSEARDRVVADTLVMQEQEKLGLGAVDNAALGEAAGDALARMEGCPSPCADMVDPSQVREYVARRLLVREFLRKRVAVFVEVNEEEVQREIQRRASRSGRPADAIRAEEVRTALYEERAAREIRNWFDRATSKSRILVFPLEGH